MTTWTERLRLDRLGFRRENVKSDAKAAVVLGVESVPDGLASGILAGVNPVAGLYAYMFGVATGALVTSTAYMAIQGTGAMAIIVNDTDLDSADDPTRALITLSMMTGVAMFVAGYLKLGLVLRYVSNSVMTGFISAVGVNIVLGQLGDFTGYDADGSNRILRAFDTFIHPGRLDLWTVVVGASTIALILWLRNTKLGAMGLVVAIIAGSILAAIVRAFDRNIQLVGNVAEVPNSLPAPGLPELDLFTSLILPALSLAFVGLIQGAGVSAGFVNPDGSQGDSSRDFIAQGVGNVAAGMFKGMPVGGSMSATSLITSAGAKSRWALVFTGGVMAMVIVLFAGVVEYVAMPALAGLLIVVGLETVKPHELIGVFKTGRTQAMVMAVTFVLTLIIPLQYSVLIGVGISMILYIVRQANQIETRRLVLSEDGGVDEEHPPDVVPAHEVMILQPYGSLFFAAAPMFEEELPTVTEESVGSVVIIRLRGKPDVGVTLLDVLGRYATDLSAVGSRLVIVTDSERIIDQLAVSGVTDQIGEDGLYHGTRRVTEMSRRAAADAETWVHEHRGGSERDHDGERANEDEGRDAE